MNFSLPFRRRATAAAAAPPVQAPPEAAAADAASARDVLDAHALAPTVYDLEARPKGLASGPPLFPLLPLEELLAPEERAVRLQGFGNHGCAPGA